MSTTRTAPYAILFLRLVLGGLFLAHCAIKFFMFTPAGTAAYFVSLGLPPMLAYITMLWEALGGLALIFGIWPRWAALAVVPILIGAIVTVHAKAGFLFSNDGGGWEFPALWIAALLVLAGLEDGPATLLPSPPRS